ncbi:hypothetical protein PUMCH_004209 [Australozyma saopauloensis]|uniref:U3 small nucleolar RNA-associated protein 10 n=1 Tax=Australozyma saopauloensis TaxID=291208 RepID=A0AAX4HE74_9ASCO|nr:hypothetical protein PUMCH_004209 [[Candida] saopauloensis]
MSSLSQQLQAISEKNASVALDRKSRSKIHARSLMFDPKVAAAQDMDFIYEIALEGLDELVVIDARFEKFRASLFAEASLTYDRNVSTKDIVDQVDKNILAFINLTSPHLNLSPSLKALEWLVRRYHVNIHNPELLLLAALPYHNRAVFTRFMSVIPKTSWPAIFSPILAYKDTLACPPASSILKCFHNDAAFFRLYSEHICNGLRQQTVYKEQLVFYLSNAAQVLASFARDQKKLNDEYIPIVLEAAVEFFKDRSFRSSTHLAADVRLTIYGIISILCSITTLSDDLVFTITKSIVLGELAFSPSMRRLTLIMLGQLWNYYNETSVPKNAGIFRRLKPSVLLQDTQLLITLEQESFSISKFLFVFFTDLYEQDRENAFEVLNYINLEGSDFLCEAVAEKLILSIKGNEIKAHRETMIKFFTKMVKTRKEALSKILAQHKKAISDLELQLLCTLDDSSEDVEVELIDDVEKDLAQHLDKTKLFAKHKSTKTNFFNAQSSDEFLTLVQILTKAIQGIPAALQFSTLNDFLVAVFKDVNCSVSFALRMAFTPSIPKSLRLMAMKAVNKKLGDFNDPKRKTVLYLLTPILLLGLSLNNKSLRAYFKEALSIVHENILKISASSTKAAELTLFMENQIYANVESSKRSLISPQDAKSMLDAIFKNTDILNDTIIDSSRVNVLIFDKLFKMTMPKQKKFGSLLLRTFFIGQWTIPDLLFTIKERAWFIVSKQNTSTGGSDDALAFVNDIRGFIPNISAYRKEAVEAGIPFEDVVSNICDMVGSQVSNDKIASKEIDWILKALASEDELQIAASKRLVHLFPQFKSTDLKLKICTELIDAITSENDTVLAFDPLELLQSLDVSHLFMVSLLGTVNIVTQIPEQGLAKRRRRSSSSTQKNMARDDITSMAANHLKKLSVILDVLEAQLRKHADKLAYPDLLQAMFRILTDLDYLCSDGKMPVLYAQETLASCMLLTIVGMKNASSQQKFELDSNSVRADLIVNSIRLSQSPQVQSRLLLVIAELASLAPEIILHSVMPIFTFMGAHTIRQDDEFSSNALQQTIAKVVPAITAASESTSTEIEFLLTSFVTAFQHIPRHRRLKLFVSLTRTLGAENSLHSILFLIAQQYSTNLVKNKTHESASLLEFPSSLLKTFSSEECLNSFEGFLQLWDAIPDETLDSESDTYAELSSRSIYGTAVVALQTKDLQKLKANMLKFLNEVLAYDEESTFSSKLLSLKMKVSLVVFDSKSSERQKTAVLNLFNRLTSFILIKLETYSNIGNSRSVDSIEELYLLLKKMLNLLPLSHYISFIVGSLNKITDPMSLKVAKNFAILAGTRFETEITANSYDDEVSAVVSNDLLPALISGVKDNKNGELLQAYLDTFAIIVSKFSVQEMNSPVNAKLLMESLKVVTSEQGLLSEKVEVNISSLNVITNIVKCLGVKCIGYFPKILPPALKLWESTVDNVTDADEVDTEADTDAKMLLQGSILMLFSCLVKKMPAFVTSNLKAIFRAIFLSDYVDNSIRSSVLALVVEHIDKTHVLQALCNLALNDEMYAVTNPANLGLYLNAITNAIDSADKKVATSQSSLVMKWLVKSFEFRVEYGEAHFSENTISSIEASFHQCALKYVMKLNDKNFRPLFAGLVRWAFNGEGSGAAKHKEIERLVAFFKIFNKLQDSLKSIITSYYSYLLDPAINLLKEFESGQKNQTNLRRLLLHSLSSSFKYDQDDYWSHQSRFDSILEPLMGQLSNIENPLGKHLVKAIAFFVSNVSSDEYNEKLVRGLIRYISNEYDNSLSTKIWTIRVLKSVFQKVGEQWLSYLPTFIPYIAELLEDDDEEVEMEVRKDLVRVIENILGEPLDRYLS